MTNVNLSNLLGNSKPSDNNDWMSFPKYKNVWLAIFVKNCIFFRIFIFLYSIQIKVLHNVVKVKVDVKCLLCSIEMQNFFFIKIYLAVNVPNDWINSFSESFIWNIYWIRHEVIDITKSKYVADTSAKFIPHAILFMTFSVM